MLKQTFIQLLSKYTSNNSLASELWMEIETNHSHKKRYYHNLQHLNDLLQQLTIVKDEIKNWDTILFTLFYHDIVYKPANSNNEEKSAELAKKRMSEIGVPLPMIDNCGKQIIGTKNHYANIDMDTNYFIDADLSILGQDPEVYAAYYKNIRKEYSIYPTPIYNTGRKKVLQHFLQMERIFKTAYFYERYERQAKQNLQMELDCL